MSWDVSWEVRWDVSGADAVAVSDRGEPLHMGVEKLGERRRLRVAQLRELLGSGLDGTVVLAQLGAGRHRVNSGRVTLGGERRRELPRVGTSRGLEPRADPLGELRGAAAGEFTDRVVTAVFGEEAERARRQFVVRGRPGRVTGIGERVVLGRTTATALRLRRYPRDARADGSGGTHGVEVTTYPCR